jgi:hypothetical protein
MTDLDQLRFDREQANAAFAAACQQLSQAQKAVHAARNRLKVAQRRYIDTLTERRAA